MGSETPEPLAEFRVTPGGGLWGARLLECATLPSTNQWAIDHLDGCRHGDVIQAHCQTAGRGRLGRRWVSPGADGLTLSLIVDPSVSGAAPDLLSPATAIAVGAVVAALAPPGVAIRLKWPNDVLADGRKIAGILAERAGPHAPVVIGIGLNVNLDEATLNAMEFPYPATSLRVLQGEPLSPPMVRACLLRELAAGLALAHPAQRAALWARWAPADALHGRELRIDTASGAQSGTYAGIETATGALLLRAPDGALRAIVSGDVRGPLT